MSELLYMRETCVSSEFYDALRLLCVKFGAAVVLTVVAEGDALKSIERELHTRGMEATHDGARLVVQTLSL